MLLRTYVRDPSTVSRHFGAETESCHSDTTTISRAHRINFLRLCRIVLEDIPGVLRIVFRKEISKKYNQEWIDGQKCGQWLFQKERYRSRLNSSQKHLLSSGQTSEWDVSLLVHALLYSSQFLLAQPFRDNQMNIKRNDRNKLVSTSPQADFTGQLFRQDIVLCDMGQELVRNEVEYISQNEITLKYPIKLQNPPQIVVYLCSRDWLAVEDLSRLRNEQFAHCSNARINMSKLEDVVQRIEGPYKDLRISRRRIDSMAAILTGKCIDGRVRMYNYIEAVSTLPWGNHKFQ